ncbi:MAG: hypothetical protein V4525_16725 [Pseudomonadota bacterium]
MTIIKTTLLVHLVFLSLLSSVHAQSASTLPAPVKSADDNANFEKNPAIYSLDKNQLNKLHPEIKINKVKEDQSNQTTQQQNIENWKKLRAQDVKEAKRLKEEEEKKHKDDKKL